VRKYVRFLETISVVSLVAIFLFGFTGAGETIQVCKIGCEFDSVARAIKAAGSGDTIKVQNGRYTEDLKIDKDLTIVGTNSRWVDLESLENNSPAIVVGPSPVTVELKNLTVNPGDAPGDTGIRLTGDASLTLANSRLSGGQLGVLIENSSYLKFRGVELNGPNRGLVARHNSRVTVFGSSVSSARVGLVAEDSSELNIIETEVTGCRNNSVIARNSAKVNLLESDVSNNSAPGVELKDFSRLNATATQISNNKGGGILLSNSAQADLKKNRITYNVNKNVAVTSKECGFSGPMEGFYGEVKGYQNEILPQSGTICPEKFSRITTAKGGTSSYPFTPSTYAFLGLIGAATIIFLVTG